MIDDLTALRLQLDWGCDEALGSEPLDRFLKARPQGVPIALPQTIPAPVPTSTGALSLGAAATLEALHEALDRFTACPLRATATHTVRPSGAPDAELVLIADAPGSDDDRSGHAFSGPAGAMLDRIMGSVGIGRDRMLLTTLVPWRPPGNRPPSESEIQACLPFVHRLLALVQPRVVLLLGAGPVAAMTGQTGTIRQLRGRWLELPIDEAAIKPAALPVLPLAQWLRDSGTKQQLWSDLLLVKKALTTA